MRTLTHNLVLAGTVFAALSVFAQADPIDDTVATLMAKRKIHGLSVAVFRDGAIVKATGYGSTDRKAEHTVTPETLFQAGSISKPVSALGALLLIEKRKLALDTDVNGLLTSWQVPSNEFTALEKVTLRRLLSHSAGVTIHGFPGYEVDEPKPTLLQILDGAKPANTRPIRIDVVPGSKWRYSGGGYTVVQQLVIDVTNQEFGNFMRTMVLEPLGMKVSTFEQPLRNSLAEQAATGHFPTGRPVPRRWHVYPEMAAAGLWTTPSDLARFAIAVQDAYLGRETSLIPAVVAREMLARQADDCGLGVFITGKGPTERFEHGGRTEGFDASLTAYRELRQGAVVMINANDDTGAVSRVLETIADVYKWQDYPKIKPPTPIEDNEPVITAKVKEIFERAKKGDWDRSNFTSEVNEQLANAFAAEEGGSQLSSCGQFVSIALVGREDIRTSREARSEIRVYRYRIVYENESIFVSCGFRDDGKIMGLRFHLE